jgi:uncharacterized protein with FMN-binding domain
MKRAVLIAGGTVGGLGAVLSVTPPQLGDNGLSTLAGASAATSSIPATSEVATTAPAATETVAPATVATKKATTTTKKSTATKSTATKKATTSTSTNSGSSSSSSATTTTPTPTATKSTTSGVNGTFTGDAINVSYGMMQVKITVSNGKITDAIAVQAPSGRNQRWTDYAIPNLKSQTLAAQSAAITGVSGASYTAYGWHKSLISALQKAGMPTGV